MTIFIPTWVDGALCAVEKLEAHEKGLRHKAVSVFVVAGGEILLQRRASSKYHTPGLWANTCCTHPNWDEASEDCASRRLDEELGLTGLVPEYRGQIEYRADVGGGLIEHEVVDVFVAQVNHKPTASPDRTEVDAIRWVTMPKLREEILENPARFTPWLKIYVEEHHRTIFPSG